MAPAEVAERVARGLAFGPRRLGIPFYPPAGCFTPLRPHIPGFLRPLALRVAAFAAGGSPGRVGAARRQQVHFLTLIPSYPLPVLPRNRYAHKPHATM